MCPRCAAVYVSARRYVALYMATLAESWCYVHPTNLPWQFCPTDRWSCATQCALPALSRDRPIGFISTEIASDGFVDSAFSIASPTDEGRAKGFRLLSTPDRQRSIRGCDADSIERAKDVQVDGCEKLPEQPYRELLLRRTWMLRQCRF